MEVDGIDLAKFAVFSFSIGAKVAIDGGVALGGRLGRVYGIKYKTNTILGAIVLSPTACEHTNEVFFGLQTNDPKTAGRMVQGIHTSDNVGTCIYNNIVSDILQLRLQEFVPSQATSGRVCTE